MPAVRVDNKTPHARGVCSREAKDILLFRLQSRASSRAEGGFEAESAGRPPLPVGCSPRHAAIDAGPDDRHLRIGHFSVRQPPGHTGSHPSKK